MVPQYDAQFVFSSENGPVRESAKLAIYGPRMHALDTTALSFGEKHAMEHRESIEMRSDCQRAAEETPA
jgi:hypothetical protein